MKKALLIIDPQNDFIDNPKHMGSLAVPGSHEDMYRLSEYILKDNHQDIFVTLDTHAMNDIAHAQWWINDKGENPAPFTLITASEVGAGKWRAANSEMQQHSLDYVEQLEKNQKYTLCIWPYHCIKNTYGHKVDSNVQNSLSAWEQINHKKVHYVIKGTNPMTEHYSGFKAEVVLDKDTELNTQLLDRLCEYDSVEVSGEALSHCVASSVRDLVEYIHTPSKITLLLDTMSSVPGFEKNGEQFISEMQALGVQVRNTLERKTLKNT